MIGDLGKDLHGRLHVFAAAIHRFLPAFEDDTEFGEFLRVSAKRPLELEIPAERHGAGARRDVDPGMEEREKAADRAKGDEPADQAVKMPTKILAKMETLESWARK